MNYIVALQEFLKNDTEINAIVWDRIWFLRMTEGTEKPCIVFNEQERWPDSFSNNDYRAWLDIFPVLIDVVVWYNDTVIWRDLRHLIRKKIGSFSWVLAGDREGNINFQKFLPCDYSTDSESVIWWWLYLFKSAFYDN